MDGNRSTIDVGRVYRKRYPSPKRFVPDLDGNEREREGQQDIVDAGGHWEDEGGTLSIAVAVAAGVVASRAIMLPGSLHLSSRVALEEYSKATGNRYLSRRPSHSKK